MSMQVFVRAFLVIFVAFMIVMSVLAIQDYFDQQDLKKALVVLQGFKLPDKKNITVFVAMQNELGVSAKQISCNSQLVSRYEGDVVIECGLQNKKYQWLVNIVDGHVEAINGYSQKLVALEPL